MFTSLPLRRSPQWQALSRPERRSAWRHHVHPLLTIWPVLLAKMGLFALAVAWALQFHVFDRPGLLEPGVVLFGPLLGADLIDLLLVARGRRHILAALSSVGPNSQPLA